MSGLFSSNDIDELDASAAAEAGDIDMADTANTENTKTETTTTTTTKTETPAANPEMEMSSDTVNNNNEQNPPDGKNEEHDGSSHLNVPPIPELTRADKTLDELLDLLDDPDFTPIIPDAVTDYYVAKSGLDLNFTSNIEATKIKRLLALATQKFISDIATDAYEYSRIRSNTAVYSSNNPQARARALMLATMAKAKGSTGNNNSSNNNDGNNTNTSNNGNDNNSNDDNSNNNANPNNGNADGDVTVNGSSLNPAGANQNKERVSLKIEDLSSALDEYGLNINRPQFYR